MVAARSAFERVFKKLAIVDIAHKLFHKIIVCSIYFFILFLAFNYIIWYNKIIEIIKGNIYNGKDKKQVRRQPFNGVEGA